MHVSGRSCRCEQQLVALAAPSTHHAGRIHACCKELHALPHACPLPQALGFISLANPLGYLACKAGPKVDVTAILANLTTSFKQTSIEEATKLNALLGAMMGAPVENLRVRAGWGAVERR
jgi:hypothetical protein